MAFDIPFLNFLRGKGHWESSGVILSNDFDFSYEFKADGSKLRGGILEG